MTRTTTRGLAPLLVSLVVLGIANPAHADRAVLPDKTGDVWLQEDGYSPAGSVVNTDLERTWVRHQKRNVVVESRFVNLKKKVSEEIEVRVHLRTGRGRHFAIFVHVDTWDGYTYYELLNHRKGGFVKCDGLTGRTRFDTDTIKFRLPRSCIGKPRSIQFQGEADSYVEDEGLFVDNANGSGPEPKTWTRRLRRG